MAAVCGLASAAACRREPSRLHPRLPASSCSSPSTRCAPIASAPTDTRGARTPVLDALARGGARFDRAYAAGADHADVARVADERTLPARPRRPAQRPARQGRRAAPRRAVPATPGFTTGAFVGAFPLDRRFGLERGFQAYGDRMPRAAGARVERTARLDGGGRGAGVAEDHRRCTILPVGAPVRTARAVRRAADGRPAERPL